MYISNKIYYQMFKYVHTDNTLPNEVDKEWSSSISPRLVDNIGALFNCTRLNNVTILSF